MDRQPKNIKSKSFIYDLARKRKGFLPGLLTSGSLFISFYSIISTINGDYRSAAIMIIIAAFLDAFDGRVARFMNSSSDFGGQYDSLADVIGFGVAPAILIYSQSAEQWGDFGISIAFVYMACCCVRLARFASDSDEGTKDFRGMPSPTAGGFVASTIWLLEIYPTETTFALYFSGLACLAAGLLMVSNLPFISGRRFILFNNHKISVSAVVVIFYFAILAIKPAEVIFFSACLYIVMAAVSGIKMKSNN